MEEPNKINITEIQQIKNILIIQTAFIGDVILITPLVNAARKLFPGSVIDVMVIPQASNIFENNPKINSIILFDKREHKLVHFFKTLKKIRKSKYDAVFTPHSSLTTALLMYLAGIRIRVGFARWTAQHFLTHRMRHLKGKLKIEKNLHLLSPFSSEKYPVQTELFPSQEMYDKANSILAELNPNSEKLIAVAPGSNWFTKRWPISYYEELVQELSKKGYGVVFIGNSEERTICEQIDPVTNSVNLAGRLTLLESAAVISKCDLMVCNDSGAMHIANAVKTDVFVFFGPTVQRIGYSPIGERDIVFELDLECRPCSSHGTKTCPLGHHDCMKLIYSETILSNIHEKFGKA